MDEEQVEVDEEQVEVDEEQLAEDEEQVAVEQVAVESWQEWGKEMEVRDSPFPYPHHPRAGRWPGDGGEAEDGINCCARFFLGLIMDRSL